MQLVPTGASRRLLAITFATSLVFALSAYGGDTLDSVSATSGVSTSTGEVTGTDGEFDPDATLRVAADFSTDGGPVFDGLDYVGHQPSRQWTDLIYDRFVYLTPDGLEPGLATEWVMSDDQMSLTLTLREGVTFHDGEEFNAEAVKKAWDRYIANPSESANASTLAMETVEVLGPYDLKVTLSEPLAFELVLKTLTESVELNVPSPAALDEFGDDYRDHPVGAGPYAFDSYDVDQQITLTRYDGYWNPDVQRLAAIQFVALAPGSAMTNALLGDRVDIAPISADEANAVEGRDGFAVLSEPSGATHTVWLCPSSLTLEQRQALAQAVDRESINQALFGGRGIPTDLIVPPGDYRYSEQASGRYPYDVEAATAAWEAADGPAELTMYVQAVPVIQTLTEVLQDQFGELGVSLQFFPVVDNLVADLQGNAETIHMVDIPGRVSTMTDTSGPGGVLNWCQYDDPEMMSLFETAQVEQTPEAWTAFHTHLNDVAQGIPLVNIPGIAGVTDRVGGALMPYEQAAAGFDLIGMYITN